MLTDRKVQTAKPKDRPYRLFDGGGLALLVQPSGTKSWQLRYRVGAKEQTATLGKLAALTLAEARAAAGEARNLIDKGKHPTAAKRTEKAEAKAQKKAERENTFEAVAAAWIEDEADEREWTPDYKAEVTASLKNHLSVLDHIPVAKVTLPLVAPTLAKLKKNSTDMHSKVRSRLNAILWYAVEQGHVVANPLPPVRRGKKKGERKHYPAVTDLPGIGTILRVAAASDPCKGIARAHLLLAFTAQRVGEIVGTTWDEVDLQSGTIAIARSRMKRKDVERGPHMVPIPPMLLAQIREWRNADGDAASYVCPAPRDPEKPITREAVEKFYRRTLGLVRKHGPHSWRSAFSTVCREAGKDGDTIESQLDHQVGSKVASAYDRSQRLELRHALVAWYESVLTAARDDKGPPAKKQL